MFWSPAFPTLTYCRGLKARGGGGREGGQRPQPSSTALQAGEWRDNPELL